jgi:hypothetical protein
LSALDSKENTIICSDKVFDLSIKLTTDVFLVNSIEQLNKISRLNKQTKQNVFLKRLPNKFDRKQAIDIAKEIDISMRSADGYLKIFQDQGKIIKQKHGEYHKS